MDHTDDNPVAGQVPDSGTHGAAAHQHTAAHGKGRHKGGHGGGHGGGWLMTYCDMITLLMTFFICLLTFSANEVGKSGLPRKRDSILHGKGGSGILMDRKHTIDTDSIVWRQLPAVSQLNEPGSQLPPIYSDPALETTAAVLKLLESSPKGTLADSYELRIPVSWFLDPEPKLSPTGKQIVYAVAAHLRALPYTIGVDVQHEAALGKALVIAEHLVNTGIAPSRVAVGIRPRPAGATGNMWMVFKRNP